MNLALILLTAVFAFGSSVARADSAQRQSARDLLKRAGAGALSRQAALRKYALLASETSDATLSAEYSLALAAGGLVEAALWELDRALLFDAVDDEVLYAGSTLLAALGHREAATDLARPAPAWLGTAKVLPAGSRAQRTDAFATEGSFKDELLAANGLMWQARYATAVDRLAHLTARYPKESMGWAAYSIALEKLGAYRTAAWAAGKEAALATDADAGTRAMLVKRQRELAARAPVGRIKPNEGLSGAYTAFAGGGFNRSSGSTSYAFNLQAGKFVADRINLSLATGYSNTSRFSIGVTGRYHQPLPGAAPVNLTGGAKVDYLSSASTLSLLLSPGASYFLRESSIDAFLDIGVLGSQKGVITFSVGYTVYFRGVGT